MNNNKRIETLLQDLRQNIGSSDMDSVMEIIKLSDRNLDKVADDICMSIARSFERMEERLDAIESRLYTKHEDIIDILKNK